MLAKEIEVRVILFHNRLLIVAITENKGYGDLDNKFEFIEDFQHSYKRPKIFLQKKHLMHQQSSQEEIYLE